MDYKYVPRVIENKDGQSRSQQTQSRRIATPCFEGFSRVSIMLPRSHLAIWAVYVYSLFCIARTEALLMASNTFIIDVFGLALVLLDCMLSHIAHKHLTVVASTPGARAAPGLIFIL